MRNKLKISNFQDYEKSNKHNLHFFMVFIAKNIFAQNVEIQNNPVGVINSLNSNCIYSGIFSISEK